MCGVARDFDLTEPNPTRITRPLSDTKRQCFTSDTKRQCFSDTKRQCFTSATTTTTTILPHWCAQGEIAHISKARSDGGEAVGRFGPDTERNDGLRETMGLTPNTVPRERDGRERCPKMFITKNLLETLEPRCVEMIQRETKRIAKRKWYPTGSQGRYFESTCHHPEVRLVVGALFNASQTQGSKFRRETGSIFVFSNSFYKGGT